MNDWQSRELLSVLQQLENTFISHVDGRDLLQEMNPLHWHHCDIIVRINGQDKAYEGDWLKRVWRARQKARALLASIDPDARRPRISESVQTIAAGACDPAQADEAAS